MRWTEPRRLRAGYHQTLFMSSRRSKIKHAEGVIEDAAVNGAG
jgi:hypothetical protein